MNNKLSRVPRRQGSRRSVVTRGDDESSVLYSERDGGSEGEDDTALAVTIGTEMSPRRDAVLTPRSPLPTLGGSIASLTSRASSPASPGGARGPKGGAVTPGAMQEASASVGGTTTMPAASRQGSVALSNTVGSPHSPPSMITEGEGASAEDEEEEEEEPDLSEYVGPSHRPRKYARSAITQSEAGISYYEEPETFREKVHRWINARPVALFFMCLIILSTFAFLLETVPELSSDPDYGDPANECVWFCMESLFIFFFTLEYFIRWFAANDPVLFPFETFNIVDIVAIAPYYVELIANGFANPCAATDTGSDEGSVVDLRFIRVIRLARVFRVLKLTSRVSATAVLVATFKNSSAALMVPLFFLLLGIVVWSSLIHLVEVGNYEQGPEGMGFYVMSSLGHKELSQFASIPDALWWSIVTSTTVGYGDMVPLTSAGKAVNSFAMIFGVLFFAMPIAIIGSEYIKAWDEKKAFDKKEAEKLEALEADAETSRLEPSTKLWGDKELKHFRLYFSGYNCTESEFMGISRAEISELPKFSAAEAEKLLPQHFNWALFSAKAKKIASQLATSDFCLLAVDAPELSGEYLRSSSSQIIWERGDKAARLISCEGFWMITKADNTYPRLRSKEKHRGSLPSLKTHWLLETADGEFSTTTAKLAPERTELVLLKDPDTFITELEFSETEEGLILESAVQEEHRVFVGRKAMGFKSTEEILVYTHPESRVSLKFYPKIEPDPSLLDLAYKVFHMHRAQGPQSKIRGDSRGEKNTQMYTRDFVAQLYHHLGFGRLPTGFRSRTGLKITCGGSNGKREFVFTSDSDLGVYGLGPGSVMPVYIIGTIALNMNETERLGQIGGELLVLAQNYYISTDRKRSQRVFMVAYRGTDVRFYSAFFPVDYLHAVSSGLRPTEDDAIEILTYPNRPDDEGLAGWSDTTKTRDKSNEFRVTFPDRGHPLELDVDDNPLRIISVDSIMTPGLQAGQRIHAVNNEQVESVMYLEDMLHEAHERGQPVVLTVSREYDALDFLNPSERSPLLSLLQKMRSRVVKCLKEDLDSKIAFAPMASPRLQDGSLGSRQLSRHLIDLGLRDDVSTGSVLSMALNSTNGHKRPHPLRRETSDPRFRAERIESGSSSPPGGQFANASPAAFTMHSADSEFRGRSSSTSSAPPRILSPASVVLSSRPPSQHE